MILWCCICKVPRDCRERTRPTRPYPPSTSSPLAPTLPVLLTRLIPRQSLVLDGETITQWIAESQADALFHQISDSLPPYGGGVECYTLAWNVQRYISRWPYSSPSEVRGEDFPQLRSIPTVRIVVQPRSRSPWRHLALANLAIH